MVLRRTFISNQQLSITPTRDCLHQRSPRSCKLISNSIAFVGALVFAFMLIEFSLFQDFEETYLYDVDDHGLVILPTSSIRPDKKTFAPTSSHGLNIVLQANLDGDTAAICLALGPMIASSANDDVRSQASLSACHKLSCMCALFKLLQKCEMCKEGNIANIDALLGCPIYSHEPVALDQFNLLPVASQIAVCTGIFYTINWFIGACLPTSTLLFSSCC